MCYVALSACYVLLVLCCSACAHCSLFVCIVIVIVIVFNNLPRDCDWKLAGWLKPAILLKCWLMCTVPIKNKLNLNITITIFIQTSPIQTSPIRPINTLVNKYLIPAQYNDYCYWYLTLCLELLIRACKCNVYSSKTLLIEFTAVTVPSWFIEDIVSVCVRSVLKWIECLSTMWIALSSSLNRGLFNLICLTTLSYSLPFKSLTSNTSPAHPFHWYMGREMHADLYMLHIIFSVNVLNQQ